MKQFEKEVLKRTNELNILNWCFLILTFWLSISILLCLNFRYKEHLCAFSLNGKCYPSPLHCENPGGGNNAVEGVDTTAVSSEKLIINPNALCENETLTITYRSTDTNTGTSTVRLDLNFTDFELPTSATPYTRSDYTGTSVGYEAIKVSGTSIGVSVYLNYFSGVSPWIDSNSHYLETIDHVITEGMTTQISNRVISTTKPLASISTGLSAGIIIYSLEDNKKDVGFDILSFKEKGRGLINPTKQLNIVSSLDKDDRLFKISKDNPTNPDENNDTGYDPYANLIEINTNLINSGCRKKNLPDGVNCPCIDPSVNVLPSRNDYHTYYPKRNLYCKPTVPESSATISNPDCVPYVDFAPQNTSVSDIKVIMPNPQPGTQPQNESDNTGKLYGTPSNYSFGPRKLDNVEGKVKDVNSIGGFQGYTGPDKGSADFQPFAFEPTKNFCATKLFTNPKSTDYHLYSRGSLDKQQIKSDEIARRSLFPNSSKNNNNNVALGFPGSGLGPDGNGGLTSA